MDSRRRLLRRTAGFAVGTVIAGCLDRSGGRSADTATVTSDSETTVTSDSETTVTSDRETPATERTSSRTTTCSPISLPMPTPTEEGTRPASYPSVPDGVTVTTVEQFVAAFERAYQRNRALGGWAPPGTDEIDVIGGVPNGAVHERSAGFAVGVSVSVKTADTNTPDTGTPAPYATRPFAAWYEVTDRRARRTAVESVESDRVPSFSDAVVVACG